jgi:hypothetical protein
VIENAEEIFVKEARTEWKTKPSAAYHPMKGGKAQKSLKHLAI